ncbi:g patch domain containing protein 1 [Echinococcus multilocularis]|uniref:G patch domain containing protein 1 n=1 Tax=Echinococcus multilocularis TaxID=6211 RepID=A0A068YGH6_ECHMU|nr:g patch domain containing protein 1 [Echinococcus multilocularis]
MEFDVFDKLSDLETKIHLQKEDIIKKDAYIQQILDQNSLLRQQVEAQLKEIAILRKTQSSTVVSTIEKDIQTDDVEIAEVKSAESAFAGSEASIADILKQTSDSVTSNSGYVFDQQTGLYFDKNSGYYYDPDNQLFFEPKSGIYYSYDNETQEYSYHSRVSTELSGKFKALLDRTRDQSEFPGPSKKSDDKYRDRRRRYSSSSSVSTDRRRRNGRRRSRRSGRRRRHRRQSSSSSYSRSASSFSSSHRSRRRSRDYNSSSSAGRRSSRRRSSRKDKDTAGEKSNPACIAATPVVYPPSVRLMVLASNAIGLAVGSVGVITSKEASSGWGCLGRNWHYCPVFDLTQDTDLDEIHCEITFNKSDESYSVRDRKTSNGTYVNGSKLEKNEKKQLNHGDVLRIGANRFLVHIHPGRETCGQCEAVEIKAAIESVANAAASSDAQNNNEQSSVGTPMPKETVRRTNADAVKIKYGLKKKGRKSGQNQRAAVTTEQPHYEDRAAKRRALEKAMAAGGQVGPSIPVVTTPASVLTPIDETNVGARLLAKMGWSKGEGLGREKGGIAEPISASMRLDHRAGLGFGNTGLGTNSISIDSTPSELRHARTLSVTRERYRQIEEKERLNQA